MYPHWIVWVAVTIATSIFSAGGAWFGAQYRIKKLEEAIIKIDARQTRVERVQGSLMRKMVQIITAHNLNHGDRIDVNKLDNG